MKTTQCITFYPQLIVDDEDTFLEEDEELSKSESLESLGGQDSSQESPGPLPQGGGMSRSLRKSAAFHDRSTLEQQVKREKSKFCVEKGI